MSPRFDMALSILPINKKFHFFSELSNDFGSGPESVFVISFDFEVIDVWKCQRNFQENKIYRRTLNSNFFNKLISIA